MQTHMDKESKESALLPDVQRASCPVQVGLTGAARPLRRHLALLDHPHLRCGGGGADDRLARAEALALEKGGEAHQVLRVVARKQGEACEEARALPRKGGARARVE